MRKLQLLISFWLTGVVIATQPAWGNEANRAIRNLNELERPATTVKDWLSQTPTTQSPIIITGVQVKPSQKGIEVILQTNLGDKLLLTNRSAGNSFIADIPNAQLRLASSDSFRQEKPTAGITEVIVTNQDTNTIRVTVTGETGLPQVELFDSNEGLIFSFLSTALSSQQPPQTQPTPSASQPSGEPPEKPSAQGDEPIELVVTGEQDGYNVPNASTATKTDTPLRDIPGSIQVIPRQLLEDRKVTRVIEAADNVPGVQGGAITFGGLPSAGFFIRGFDTFAYRDGFRDYGFQSPINTANIEQIEFLKGPASVLYGQNQPGGIVNIVTKQPLLEPYYSPSFTVGSYDYYNPALDISGPLNAQKTVAYRLNLSYENAGSFRDFVNSETIFVAPTISWQISPKTKIRFNAEYNRYKSIYDYGLPPEPESLQVPISRFIGEPDYGDSKFDSYRVGYLLEHQFNDNWKFRNGFTAIVNDSKSPTIFGFGLNEDRRTIERSTNNRSNFYESYSLQNEIVGKFKTGSVEHQLLLGAEISRDSRSEDYFDNESTIASIDLFNPVYGARPENTGGPIYSRSYVDDALGFYIQDQVTLTNNLKLLLGGRFDLTRQTAQNNDGRDDESTASAFSPRAGIVYQPIEPVSLYFSYATSFVSQLDADFYGNPFYPERGRQFEVGIKADLIPKQLSTTVAAYQIKKQNVLVTDPQHPDFSIQTGEQTSQGIEFDLIGRPLDGLNISVSYAYIDAFVSKDTDPTLVDQGLVGIPKHQFGLWTSYELQRGSLKGLGVGLGLYYTSATEGQLPNTVLQIPSYFRVDASAFYKRDNWKVQLNVKNLTNIDYYKSQGYWIVPQEPLTVLGSISFEF